MREIAVIGGGLAGLTAAITAAEGGARVRLLVAHATLGGRARSTEGSYKANLGPHVLYKDGQLWAWLHERGLPPRTAAPPLSAIRVRWEGEIRRTPPLGSIPTGLRLRGRDAPSTARSATGCATTPTSRPRRCSAPGQTSTPSPRPRRAVGCLRLGAHGPHAADPAARRALHRGRMGHAGRRPRGPGRSARHHDRDRLPRRRAARRARGRRDGARRRSPAARRRRAALAQRPECLPGPRPAPPPRCPCIVSDVDEAGWIERFSAADPSLAPEGEELVQAQMPIRPGESADAAIDVWSACSTSASRRGASARVAAPAGDGGPLRRLGPTRHDLARTSCDAPRQRPLPRRGHGRRPGTALRGRVGERPRGRSRSSGPRRARTAAAPSRLRPRRGMEHARPASPVAAQNVTDDTMLRIEPA